MTHYKLQQSRKNLGYTLMELMVTVSIAGIVTGLAVPNFIGTIRSNRLTTQVNEFVTTLNLARSESVKRGKMVVVRKTGTNWENGWQVFVDVDRSTTAKENVFNDATAGTTCEAGVDCVLRVYQGLPSTFTLRGTAANYIRYEPTGKSNVAASFVICDNTDGNNLPEAYTAKLLTISATGRIGLAGDDDNDGIPNKASGAEITSCITSPFT